MGTPTLIPFLLPHPSQLDKFDKNGNLIYAQKGGFWGAFPGFKVDMV
jgi:hypothetical protein